MTSPSTELAQQLMDELEAEDQELLDDFDAVAEQRKATTHDRAVVVFYYKFCAIRQVTEAARLATAAAKHDSLVKKQLKQNGKGQGGKGKGRGRGRGKKSAGEVAEAEEPSSEPEPPRTEEAPAAKAKAKAKASSKPKATATPSPSSTPSPTSLPTPSSPGLATAWAFKALLQIS